MSLTDIASIASIAGSVALAVSLIYVAMQLRQAEKNQRGLMLQGRVNRLCDQLLHMTEPGMGALWTKGVHTPEDFSAEELERYLQMTRAGFLSGEDTFLQHRAGLFDETAFRSFVTMARGQMSGSRGFRAAWRVLSPQFGSEFNGFMNEILAQTTPQPPAERLQQWTSALQEPVGT